MGYNVDYLNAFEKLTLNGNTFYQDELLHLTGQKMKHADTDDDEFAMYSFIHQWVSPSEIIEVRTSGSTGEPKLKVFRKEQMIESARVTAEYFHLYEGTSMLLCLSANYIAGKMMIVRAFVSGANLITVPPTGNPLEDLHGRVDFTAMVPLQAQNAIADPATNKFFASVRNIIIGGASVSPKLEHQLSAYSNNIYATFAMTETLSHIALRKISGDGQKDLYALMPGVKIMEDERGCMVIDAPHLSDERIITNDIIVKTDEKHFHWLGRYDNVINSGGVKIYPEAVEAKLANLFDEKRFFISSMPDETLGQKVVLVIESKSVVDKNDLQTRIEKLVDKYEVPKEYYTIPEFTETPNGKVQRQETLKLAIK